MIEAQDAAAGREMTRSAAQNTDVETASLCLISRDYGMFDRTEAPQYFPPVDAARP